MPRSLVILAVCLWPLCTAGAQEVSVDWIESFNLANPNHDRAADVEVDGSGNIYIAGFSDMYQFTCVKYLPFGMIQWVHDSVEGRAADMVLDGDSLIYITGYGTENWGDDDFLTVKMTTQGETRWIRYYTRPGSWRCRASAIDLGSDGSIFVTGLTSDEAGGNSITMVRYYPNGDTAWVRTHDDPEEGSFHSSLSMSVDNAGNCYVGYASSEFYPGPTQWRAIKYDSSGEEQWEWIFDPSLYDNTNVPYGIATDNMVGVYVVGNRLGEFLTVKLSSDGDTVWTRSESGEGTYPNNGNAASAVEVDNFGCAFVTGQIQHSSVEVDVRTIRYSPQGDIIWTADFSSPIGSTGSSSDGGKAIAVDGYGCTYVVGGTYSDTGNWTDVLAVKYDTAGQPLWAEVYDEPDSEQEAAVAVSVNDSGVVSVVGTAYFESSGYTSAMVCIKLVQNLCCQGTRGNIDSDSSDQIDIADLVYLVDYMFSGGPAPACSDEANVDGTVGVLDIADLVYVVDYMFSGGPAPVACPY